MTDDNVVKFPWVRFSDAVREKGLGFLYGLSKKFNESEEEYTQRIQMWQKQMKESDFDK